MARKTRAAKDRLTPEDWAHAALRAIAKDGIKAVAVEPLAKQLGVTKGSFYWHFKNRDELIRSAVTLWEDLGDQAITTHLESIENPRMRLRALFYAAFDPKNAHALLHHLASSRNSPLIGPVLERVTARRITSLTEMYQDCGLERAIAHQRALVAYATYVGMFQIRATAPEATPSASASNAFIQHLVDTLVPIPD